MWDFFAKLRNLLADRQQSGMRFAPIIVNPNDSEKVQIAIGRLNAIAAHREQCAAERRTISEQKARDFRNEAREHGAMLLKAGRIDEEEHARLLKGAGVQS